MPTQLDARQSVLRSALSMVGSAANDSLDTIFPKISAELAKLFEDRNILLTDGGIITFTGTTVLFTQNLNIVLNSKVAGGAPVVISLGSTTRNFTANGAMLYAVIDRLAGTAVVTDEAATLPAVTSANQEVFLIAKREDSGDGVKRLYFRTGMALDEGQSARLGASGSGSGTGNEYMERMREQFEDGIYELLTPVVFSIDTDDFTDAPNTTAVYNLIKKGYVFSAAQKWTSIQMIDSTFLAEERDIGKVDVFAFWNAGEVDANATYKVSRNNGNEYQTVTMTRVPNTDAFYGTLDFATEASNQTISSNTAGGAGATEVLNATTGQAIGQPFTVASTWVTKQLSAVTVNKTGSPVGTLWFDICRDSAGSPGAVIGSSQTYVISSLSAGANVLTPQIAAVLPAGTYHIVARTSDAYKAAFSSGITQITLNTRTGSSATDMKIYNGTTWSAVVGEALHYSLDGRELVMKVEVTSSAGSVTLMSVGLFYGALASVNAPIDLAQLLADNRLGSTNASRDRSVAGEGILLRSTNGDLVEISVLWNGTSHELVLAKVN